MRTRWVVLSVGLAAVVAACTHPLKQGSSQQLPAPTSPPPAIHVPGEILVLRSDTGVIALDPATGSVLYDGEGVSALADLSRVFTATYDGTATLLQATSLTEGAPPSTVRLPGDLAIRVVSPEGSEVALMAPLPKGGSPWRPVPRAFTNIVVADPEGQVAPRRFHLKGNFEPEAFSGDGQSLFVIRYLPPTAPVAYQVARLDLNEGEIYPVFGREKTPVETMTGTRLMQVPSPAATMLYTLYTSQPPAYAKGYDQAQAHAGRPVAFVHTLSLDQGWAICVGLPKELWGGSPSDEALAVSPDGRQLYVVDTARGVVTAMDTDQLTVVRTARVDFGSLGTAGAPTHATVRPDGTALLVARGSGILTIDTATLRPEQAWAAAAPLSGLGFSADGLRLYLAMSDEIEMANPSTGQQIGMIPARGLRGSEYVGTLAP